MFEKTARKYFLKIMEFEKAHLTKMMEDGYDSGEYTATERIDIIWIGEIFLAAFEGIVQYMTVSLTCLICSVPGLSSRIHTINRSMR